MEPEVVFEPDTKPERHGPESDYYSMGPGYNWNTSWVSSSDANLTSE
jgi:hypothetical protein